MGLKASTHENLVRGREKIVLFHRKNMLSQGLYDHDTMCLFFNHKHYHQRAKAQMTVRQTLIPCDLEQALRGHFIYKKLSVIVSSVTTFTVLHHMTSILIFNIPPFF
jgi:hypothetical protein